MSEKTFPKARSLTAVEVVEMRNAGKDPVFMSKEEKEKKSPAQVNVEIAEWMRDNIFKGQFPETYAYGDLIRLGSECYLLTYGKIEKTAEETKNS